MSRQRLAFAWIACFAVLFNMLAMPLSNSGSATANLPSEQILWGSFCSSSGTKMVAVSLGKFEQGTPQKDTHSTMQHCWCCSGPAPLLARGGAVEFRMDGGTMGQLSIQIQLRGMPGQRHQRRRT